MTPGQRLRLADRLAWVAVTLTAIASVAGLAVPGVYGDRDALVRLTQADDVFRLAIVLPILAIGLASAAHGSITGRLAALGALATLAYLYAFLAFGAALSAATLAHITILGLVFWSLLLLSTAMDPRAVERVVTRRLLRRTTAVFLVAIAGLSVLQWSATILGAVASGTLPADVAEFGWATSPLYAIELAFVVPLMAVAGIGLLRRDAGGALTVPLLIFLALLGLGLVWEAVFVALGGTPFDPAMAIAGLLFLALPALLLVPAFVDRNHGAERRSPPVSDVP